MSSLDFKAAVVSIYVEHDVLTVAFANSESPDPTSYLILQQDFPRAVDSQEDDYYFEINDRSISGEGGFKEAILTNGNLKFVFSNSLATKYSYSSLKIFNVELVSDVDELSRALNSIFYNTGCRFFGM